MDESKPTIIVLNITKAYRMEDCIKHLEKCMTVTPKFYNVKLEGVPTGFKPTRLF